MTNTRRALPPLNALWAFEAAARLGSFKEAAESWASLFLEVERYPPMTPNPDPHGQAALMLCDGLMLLLIETGVIDGKRAAGVIEGIIEVKQEIAGVRESVVVSVASISLLRAVARSLAVARGPEALPT